MFPFPGFIYNGFANVRHDKRHIVTNVFFMLGKLLICHFSYFVINLELMIVSHVVVK